MIKIAYWKWIREIQTQQGKIIIDSQNTCVHIFQKRQKEIKTINGLWWKHVKNECFCWPLRTRKKEENRNTDNLEPSILKCAIKLWRAWIEILDQWEKCKTNDEY